MGSPISEVRLLSYINCLTVTYIFAYCNNRLHITQNETNAYNPPCLHGICLDFILPDLSQRHGVGYNFLPRGDIYLNMYIVHFNMVTEMVDNVRLKHKYYHCFRYL